MCLYSFVYLEEKQTEKNKIVEGRNESARVFRHIGQQNVTSGVIRRAGWKQEKRATTLLN